MTALIVAGIVAVLLILLISASVKVAREYERGVIFRLGRLLPEPKGPGLFLLIPVIDRMVKVDLRTVTLNVPPQEVITKDNVPVRVNAVAYFRIVEPKAAIVQIENYMVATSQISQTTLRSVLGQHVLDELLSERDKINAILQQIIDEATVALGHQGLDRRGQGRRDSRATCSARWRARPRPSASGARRSSPPRASSRPPQRLDDAAAVMAQAPITAAAALPADAARDRVGERDSTIVFPHRSTC